MYREALVDALIQKIYAAAVGGTAWMSFLVSLAGALDSAFPSLYFVDPSRDEGSIALSVGMADETRRSYGEYYHQRNVWIQGARELLRPGVIRSSHTLCSRRKLLRSEWYADFCRPLGWSQGLGVTILEDGSLTGNIGVFSDDRRRPYDLEDFGLLKALMPHLQSGLKVHLHLAASESRGRAFEAIVQGLPTPALLVTAPGQVLFLNAAAERLIRAARGLSIEGGQLGAIVAEESKSLRAVIAGAARSSAGQGRKAGGTVRISTANGEEPLEVLVSPLPQRTDEWMHNQVPAAAVLVTDRAHGTAAKATTLSRLHGLTAMETRVALAVARGISGKEICRELAISYNTLKTHLRHIHSKTLTRHHAELVRVLLGEGPADPAGRAS